MFYKCLVARHGENMGVSAPPGRSKSAYRTRPTGAMLPAIPSLRAPWSQQSAITASRPSPRVAQARSDAADGSGDGSVDFVGIFAGSLAAQQVDLDEAHGVDVGIAQDDGAGQDRVRFEQVALICDGEDGVARALEFLFEHGEDALAQRCIGDQRGVERGDAEVGLSEGHFDVAHDIYK